MNYLFISIVHFSFGAVIVVSYILVGVLYILGNLGL